MEEIGVDSLCRLNYPSSDWSAQHWAPRRIAPKLLRGKRSMAELGNHGAKLHLGARTNVARIREQCIAVITNATRILSLSLVQATSPLILIEGFDNRLGAADIRKLFAPHGQVLEVTLIDVGTDPAVDRYYTASVTVDSQSAANSAIAELDGMWFRGRKLRVSVIGKGLSAGEEANREQ